MGGWWNDLVPGQGDPVAALAGQGLGSNDPGFADGGNLNFNPSQYNVGDHTKPYSVSGYNIDPNAYVNPNAAPNKAAWGAASAGAQGRQAPQIAQGPQNQFRQGQGDLISALQAQANGTGPSLADYQNQQATQRNLSAAAALQGSARGANAGTQARSVQEQAGAIGQQSASDAVAGRLAEQTNARNQLGNVLAGARDQDIGMAQGQAQLGLQQTGLNDQMQQYYAGLGATTDAQSFAAQQGQQQLQVQNALGYQGINAGADAANKQFYGQLAGAGASAAGSVVGAIFSDRRAKKDVKDGNEDIYNFLDALRARDFQYRDPSAPGASSGPKTGVMAQDMEKSKVGQQLVENTPTGKMIDSSGSLAAALAGLSNLHERMKMLETGGKVQTSAPQSTPAVSTGRRILDWMNRQADAEATGVGG